MARFTMSLPTRFAAGTVGTLLKDTEVKKIAENASSYSTSPNRVSVPVESALEAIATIFAVSAIFPERAGFLKMDILEKIARIARNYQYEGKWSLVQELLETKNIPYYLSLVLCEHFSPEDLFGNLAPLVRKKALQIKFRKYQTQKPRVRYPKRKRGYDDKGSLRPSHLWLPKDVHLGPNPEREDRTHRISYPRNKAYWLNLFEKGRKEK